MNDQAIYFVEVDYGGRIGKTFVETDRDANSRKQIIHNIRVGEYRAPVVTVIECNPVERTSRDVTEDFLEEAETRPRTFDRPDAADRQTAKWDHARDYRKHAAAE